MTAEYKADLVALRVGLFADLRPVGEIETLLMDRITLGMSRLRRVVRFEVGYLENKVIEIENVVSCWVCSWNTTSQPYLLFGAGRAVKLPEAGLVDACLLATSQEGYACRADTHEKHYVWFRVGGSEICFTTYTSELLSI